MSALKKMSTELCKPDLMGLVLIPEWPEHYAEDSLLGCVDH